MALKRSNEGLLVPKSPSKKTKVQNQYPMQNYQPSPQAPLFVQDEVRHAIKKHLCGDNVEYERLKAFFEPGRSVEDVSNNVLVEQYTQALLSNISLLQNSCSDLVQSIIHSDWALRSDQYVSLYMQFLANLVSIKGTFLVDILRMLADHFTFEPASLEAVPQFSRALLFNRAHRVLQYIIRLVPAASHILLRILSNAFPHQSDSRRAHVVYVRNLLKLLEYARELRDEILALITDRLVKIDVQVQEDLEDLAEDISEGVVHDCSSLDNDLEATDASDTEAETGEYEAENNELQRKIDIRKNVGKMDAVMTLLFEHYEREVSSSKLLGAQEVLDTLFSQFVRTILPMQRSRHTQFLLFHFAQSSSQSVDTFVGTCIEIAFDQRQPIIIRHSAAAYLGSFVARGANVPPTVVRDVYDYIGQELDTFRKSHEPTCQGPDIWRYSSYYNLIQSILYIFCFRWRDLEYNLDEDGDDGEFPTTLTQDHEWRPGVKEVLSQNLFSRLNPLKVCSPSIVSEFARIAKHLGIVYVYHLLETNKRIRLSHHTSSRQKNAGYGHFNQGKPTSSRLDESDQHLDAFFPFDPYHLPRSKKWIENDYREWKEIPGLEEDSDDELDDSEDEVLEDIVREDMTNVTEDIEESP